MLKWGSLSGVDQGVLLFTITRWSHGDLIWGQDCKTFVETEESKYYCKILFKDLRYPINF